MRKLRWNVFELNNPGRYVMEQFENLCRQWFVHEFLSDTEPVHANPNQAGIETEPAWSEKLQKKVGFQCKYFTGSGSSMYTEIEKSLSKVPPLYAGNLDCVYLLSNKQLDRSSKTYQRIEKQLKDYKIDLVLICGDILLDKLETCIMPDKESWLEEYWGKDYAKETYIFMQDLQDRLPPSQAELLQSYYESQVNDFTLSNISDSKEILGEASLSESYISPLTVIEDEYVSLLDTIEEWAREEPYGVLLLHGQPGDGKTSLCRKAVYEFAVGNKYGIGYGSQETKAVLRFALKNWNIEKIIGDNIGLDSIFYDHESCGDTPVIKTLNASNTLIFLDGYDEVKQELQKKGIRNYKDLHTRLLKIARNKRIHFVVTSRSNAVNDVIDPKSNRAREQEDIKAYSFAPLTTQQQEEWCHRDSTYQKRWEEYFREICTDQSKSGVRHDFRELLTISFIFRMTVHSDYRMESGEMNQAKLYGDLFHHTMRRVGKNAEECEALDTQYQKLAYLIWCNDTDTAVVTGEEVFGEEETGKIDYLLFSYYLKEVESQQRKKNIGFLHRSFYQYYMALYLFRQMMRIEMGDTSHGDMSYGNTSHGNAAHGKISSEDFLKLLAERRLDEDILRFFWKLVENEKQGEYGQQLAEQAEMAAKSVMLQMAKTECIIPVERKNPDGDSEQSSFRRCNNIFWNGMRICFYFDIVDTFNQCQNLKELIRRYDCKGIKFNIDDLSGRIFPKIYLDGVNLYRADLRGADLRGADLGFADLIEADLRGADLIGADLRGAHLDTANLVGANLVEANLNRASLHQADLSGADLRGADLSMAGLYKANLSFADLCYADLRYADLSGADLRGADLSYANLNSTHLDSAKLRRGALDRARNVDKTETDKIIWIDS